MMTAELEIAIHRRDTESYNVDLRFVHPESDSDVRPAYGDLEPLRINPEAFLRAADPQAHGQTLAQALFVETKVQAAFEKALAAAQVLDAPLRVRLFIGPSAPELHNLRWETLIDPTVSSADPATATPLLTNENIIFSRYLSSLDWRPVRLRPQRDLSALVVIAAPDNVTQYGMAAVNVEQELETARTGLGDIACTELAEPRSATLDNIIAHLRDEVDILYLVAHGALANGEPVLYLEDESGKTKPTRGSELVTRLRELTVRPRLVVLASCQSAGDGNSDITAQDEGALAGLGPRLAEVGVPAVLAMQGKISMETVRQFMPLFFEELRSDGQIDRAMAAARGRVRARYDWWMPVLFMRLKSGRIWYVPGFGDDRQGLKQWPALLNAIKRRKCTPILGPGIGDNLLGSRQEIAQRWAETYGFPLEPHQKEDLPQVAQFVNVIQQRYLLESELENHLRREIWQKFSEVLDAALEDAPLEELLSAAGTLYRAENEQTIYQLLAQLDLPVYITTSADNLLFDALVAQGKDPIYDFCRWNPNVEHLPLLYDEKEDDPPTTDCPLIYHLFGHLSEPESLVLTEDDYFDYLIGVTSNNDLIPSEVRRVFADTGLLFLGFRIDDWDFRVLFRSIMQRQGGGRRSRYPHIAAQINPEEERILEPAGARQYLEARFQDTDVAIFWGSVEDFQRALRERLK